jgi:hypothetical protein
MRGWKRSVKAIRAVSGAGASHCCLIDEVGCTSWMKKIVEQGSADSDVWVGYLYVSRGVDEIGGVPLWPSS